MFVTADWHLGETRMELMQRPFHNDTEMYNVLLENHNRLVKPDDLVYVNGDVVSKAAEDPKMWLPLIENFHGRKILLRGNHDEQFTDEELKPYFDEIHPQGVLVNIDLGALTNDIIPISIQHYPICSVADRFNLVGHIHGAWKYQKNMLNIGVDVHHYRPVPFSRIPFYLKAITLYYDEDVFCAAHPANAAYDLTRGKKGSYFGQSNMGGKAEV